MTFGQIYAFYLAPLVLLAFGMVLFAFHLLSERRWRKLAERSDKHG